jgi:hypothetical protein
MKPGLLKADHRVVSANASAYLCEPKRSAAAQ